MRRIGGRDTIRTPSDAAIAKTAERDTENSFQCLLKAYAEHPDSEDVLDALVTTLFNGGRHKEGFEFARRQLAVSSNPALMARAAAPMDCCVLCGRQKTDMPPPAG